MNDLFSDPGRLLRPARVDFPNSLWKCAGCDGRLQSVYLERHGMGIDAVVICHCSKCLRILKKASFLEIDSLYSKRLKPEQGELPEMAIRCGLIDLSIVRSQLDAGIMDR